MPKKNMSSKKLEFRRHGYVGCVARLKSKKIADPIFKSLVV